MHLACTQTLGDEGVYKFMIAQNNKTWLVINYVIFSFVGEGSMEKSPKAVNMHLMYGPFRKVGIPLSSKIGSLDTEHSSVPLAAR